MKPRTKAALLSGLAYPGLGQIYNKQSGKAAALIVSITLLLIWLLVRIFLLTYHTILPAGAEDIAALNLDPKLIAHLHHQVWAQNWWVLILIAAAWIYAMVDAYLMAGKAPRAKAQPLSRR